MADRRKLSDFAIGNAVVGGPSSVSGVSDEMARRFEAMAAAMPPEVLARLQVTSGFRDAARQAQVNPGVTNSRHMHGMAIDLGNDPVVLDWVNQHGQEHGLGFPLKGMANEQNHLEMIDPDTGQRTALGSQYAANPGPNVKTGLRRFGVAEANLPEAGGDYGGGGDAPVAPVADDNRELLAYLALQQNGGLASRLGGPSTLSGALTQGMQPAPVQPQPILASQPSIIGGPLPLARRLT